MRRVTLKTSTIFISSAGKTRVYRSVNDVPDRLRKKLEDSTNSLNSATILIADRGGREEIVRAIQGLPTPVRSRLSNSLKLPDSSAFRSVIRWRRAAEVLLPAAAGVLLWLIMSAR